MAKKLAVVAARLLRPQPEEFWTGVHIFPSVIRKGAVVKDYNAQTLAQLKKCGANNLRLLAERATINSRNTDAAGQLAARLRSADSDLTLNFLAEFIRGKGRAINEEYELLFSNTERRSHEAQLEHVSHGRKGPLKQFTKLILIYEQDEEAIRRIFVRKLWRGKKTTCSFDAPRAIDARFLKQLDRKTDSLATSLTEAISGFDLRFFCSVVLGSWNILLLQREYAPVVRPDYRDKQKTLHGLGWIMLGLEKGTNRIQVKGGGKKALPVVQTWFQNEMKTDLVDAESQVVSNYDPFVVENSLLGNYAEDCPVRLTGMSFRRTLAPQHSSMTIEPPFPGQDIRRDLQFGKDNKLFRIRSLSDLSWFRVRFRELDHRVDVSPEPGGAVTLRLDNADLSEVETDELCKQFSSHFGIPLNRRIDPQNLALGVVDVFNYLLEIDRTDGIADYQRKGLDGLISQHIVSIESSDVLVCPKQPFICKLGGQPVADNDLTECPECQTDLVTRRVDFVKHNDAQIRKLSGKLLANATGWKFSGTAVQFEGQQFYLLSDPDRPDRIIRVYFAKRVSERMLQCLDRSLQPILVVHTGGDVEHAHLDAACVAHISFARALAASVDPEVSARFDDDIKFAKGILLRMQEGKVFTRAARSHNHIQTPPDGYSGEAYQLDVFNVIRSIFPYTEYWTGANRPDGFCSLVYFENASLRQPVKHNWSYDAKFTRETKGYDLSVSEERKAWDYVEALAIQPELSAQGDELNGHVIISNNLNAEQMGNFAKFFRREHRLGKSHPKLRIVFIIDAFLCKLYERVRDNEAGFRKRGNWLSLRLANQMNQENDAGYVLLDETKATELCDWVLKQKEIETPPDMPVLRDGLAETMTKS